MSWIQWWFESLTLHAAATAMFWGAAFSLTAAGKLFKERMTGGNGSAGGLGLF